MDCKINELHHWLIENNYWSINNASRISFLYNRKNIEANFQPGMKKNCPVKESWASLYPLVGWKRCRDWFRSTDVDAYGSKAWWWWWKGENGLIKTAAGLTDAASVVGGTPWNHARLSDEEKICGLNSESFFKHDCLSAENQFLKLLWNP